MVSYQVSNELAVCEFSCGVKIKESSPTRADRTDVEINVAMVMTSSSFLVPDGNAFD